MTSGNQEGGAGPALRPPTAQRLLVHNPALWTAAQLERVFVAHTGVLEEILAGVRSAPHDDAPQHMLVLGERGMGKTTLLQRVADRACQDPELEDDWLALVFAEEQYGIGELADLWLNTLDLLGAHAPGLEGRVEALTGQYRGAALEEAARLSLEAATEVLGRRLLLLVDNIDLVLARIDPDVEASMLREVLQTAPWLMVVGASSRPVAQTYRYDEPFYEQFTLLELGPLTPEEGVDFLVDLSQRLEAPQVNARVEASRPALEALLCLLDGSPRALGLLFEALAIGPEPSLPEALELVLDRLTPLYRERLDALALQSQRVLLRLAVSGRATARQLAVPLRMDRGAVSGQLHRLHGRDGLVDKVDVPGRAIGFEVREQLFGTWCVMRSGRAGRQTLRDLAAFCVDWFQLVPETHVEQLSPKETRALFEALEEDTRAERVVEVLRHVAEARDSELALQAAAMLSGRLQLTPDDPLLLLGAAEVGVAIKRFEPAADHLSRAAELLGPSDVRELAPTLLRICAQIGQTAEGLDATLEALEVLGCFEPLRHALAVAGGDDPDRLRRLPRTLARLTERVLDTLAWLAPPP